jgi:high-affinity Fe2+/Pb2+ permease
MATATRITRDDLEAKLREMAGGVEDTVESARPQIVTGAVAGLLLAVLVAYLLGRRAGRKRSAVIEIRKV